MTESEYRSHPSVSRSELWKLISEGPEKFNYLRSNPQPPTNALIFGQAFHMAVLQPEIYDDNFAAPPSCDRRTKAGKEVWSEFIALNKNKVLIPSEWQEQIMEMKNKLMSDSFVRQLLSGDPEKPFFWTDNLTGEGCKCRADCVTEIGGAVYVVDLKTTENAATDKFMKKSIDYGYPLQAAMYCEGVKQATGRECSFVFIAIEKTPPYAVNIMQADEIYRQYGYDIFRETLGIYHDCKINNNWYGYLGKFHNINVLGLPAYLAKEFE